MFLEMNVEGFAVDPLAKLPVVVLRESGGDRRVPVFIEPMEAVALATGLAAREASSGSLKRDFLEELLLQLGVSIQRFTLDSLKERVFSASIHLLRGDEPLRIEAAAVEVILLSLKYRMPVFVAPEAARVSVSDAGDGKLRIEDPERYADFLENLDPSDLGKYPM